MTYALMLLFVFMFAYLMIRPTIAGNIYNWTWRIRNGGTRNRIAEILTWVFALLAVHFFHNIW